MGFGSSLGPCKLLPVLLLTVACAALAVQATGSGTGVECAKKVKVGQWDTCTSISTSHFLTPRTFLALNPGLDCNRMKGSVCVASGKPTPPPPCGKFAEARANDRGHISDTCTSIAVRNSVPNIRTLLRLNPGLDCSRLEAGELLCVEEHHAEGVHNQCVDWDEVISDGKTNPCDIFPSEFNPYLPCGTPFPAGSLLKGCKMSMNVPAKKAVCTRFKSMTSDGATNYCLLQGGYSNKDDEDGLIRHLQLNPQLYCGKGAQGGDVLICDEGYLMDPLEDVNTPGSYTRDHLILKLLKKLQNSPRLPKFSHTKVDETFAGGTRGSPGTDAHFIRGAKKLPEDSMNDASILMRMAASAMARYKSSSNQMLAHGAWAALMKVLTLVDFSVDLFDLQRDDAEFDAYVKRSLMHAKREAMCQVLAPAVLKRPQLAEGASCMCSPDQHILRCEMILSTTITSLKEKELGHQGGLSEDDFKVNMDEDEGSHGRTRGDFENRRVKNHGHTSRHSSAKQAAPSSRNVPEDEYQSLYRAGADPDLGTLNSSDLETMYDRMNLTVVPHTRGLLQPNTAGNKVVDGKLLVLTEALLYAKKEICNKVKSSIDDGMEKLKQFAATCVVTYDKNADLCGGDLTCASIGCPAIDLQLAHIRLTGTLCIAIPRDVWIRCRAGCRAMQDGYSALKDSTDLNCPEACIRYVGDAWLSQFAEIGVSVCLGGSALNVIKWLDDLVPDWVEKALGIKWENLLCVNLVKARVYYVTGLFTLTFGLNLVVLKVDLQFSIQLYRPVNYPEVCDCNVSPWACEPFCLKSPGGVIFKGSIMVGVKVKTPWPLPDFDLTHTERFDSHVPSCTCPALTTVKVDSLCTNNQGLVPTSSSCASCPLGLVTPNGATCLACPAGSIPSTDGTNCLYCAVGYVAPNPGSTSCTKCQPPLTSQGAGGKACYGKCPPGTGITGTTCVDCTPGTYNPGTTTGGTCNKCSKGFYAPKTRSAKCEPCKPGTQADTEGSASCSKCPAGSVPSNCECLSYGFIRSISFAKVGALAGQKVQTAVLTAQKARSNRGPPPGPTTSSVLTKLLGDARTPAFQGATGASPRIVSLEAFDFKPPTWWAKLFCSGTTGCKACSPCPAGSFSKPGDASCTPCPLGFYQPATGKSSCIPCPVGTASTTVGSTSCGKCPAGTFATGCRPFFAMKLGFFSTIISIPLVPIPIAGLASTGNSAQLASTTNGVVYESRPAAVSGGSEAGPAAVIGRAPAFTFDSNYLRPTALGCTQCKPCDPGFYNRNEGQVTCSTCPSGYYQPAQGSTTCTPCPAGTHSPFNGSTSCQKCKKGSYAICDITAPDFNRYQSSVFLPGLSQTLRLLNLCLKGLSSNKCATCPGVTYNTKTNKIVTDFSKLPTNTTIPATCPQPCKPGTYSKNGLQPCKSCKAGWFAGLLGAKACKICPANTFSVPSTAAFMCLKCPIFLQRSPPGSSSIAACKITLPG